MMKKQFTGYLCQSREPDESYGYGYYLCQVEPKIVTVHSFDNTTDELIVPPDNIESEHLFGLDDIDFEFNLELGKKYTITIEEI